MYKTILVAVDLASYSDMLCNKARSLAKIHSASLSLVSVIEPAVTDSAFDTLPPLPDDFEDLRMESARKRLKHLADSNDIESENCYLEIGVVKHEIIRLSEELQADLIIVGSHGRHGVQLLLGSTANAVLHHAKCDVLAVRIQE